MLVRTGTTTVADIEAVPDLLPRVWEATPLRVFSFLEMIGITSRRQPAAVLQEAVDKIDSLRRLCSPPGPLASCALLHAAGAAAFERRRRSSPQMARSPSTWLNPALEFEMFTRRRGEMFDWLQRSGRDMSDCGQGSPVHHLERCGLLSNRLLAVHANYLGRSDAARLGQRGVHVVHCPRSHAYFGHHPFPLRQLGQSPG